MLKQHTRLLAAFMAVLLPAILVLSLDLGKASALQFQNRTFYINSVAPSASTFYEVSVDLPASTSIGSLEFQFCDSALVQLPCGVPTGIDVSSATLDNQQGETGFSILSQNTNNVILSRAATASTATTITYRFGNVINPSTANNSFYVRVFDYPTTDATGPYTDYGAAVARLNDDVTVYAQVPPVLVFCVAQAIFDDQCNSMNGTSSDLGELSSTTTRTATSEMLAFTNAAFGYSIVVSGNSITAGVNALPALGSPTPSFTGVGQFGINLVGNSSPAIGANPSGIGTGAPAADYAISNRFTYRNGDVLAFASGATMPNKFTTSYIVNIPANQAPGIYSTTLSYICTASF